jgi:hypothetical protein
MIMLIAHIHPPASPAPPKGPRMSPGRELDALVAERVMGWRFHGKFTEDPNLNCDRWAVDPDGHERFYWEVPDYSTKIAAAWAVVEKITSEHWIAMDICQRPKQADAGEAWTHGNKACVTITHGGQSPFSDHPVYGESAAHAICLKALKLFAPREGET